MRDGLENEDADDVYTVLLFLIANTEQLTGFGETNGGSFANTESRRAIVPGDGDTTTDCACTPVYQGTKYVTCVCRCDEENMPGFRREARDVREEGTEFKFNIQPPRTEVNGSDKVNGVKVVCTEIGEPDAKDRRRVEIVTGSEHTVPTDAVIIAFGFRPYDMEWLAKHNIELDSQGRVITPEGSGSTFQTNNPKALAGDDTVRGFDLVVTTIAEGRKAVDGTMNWLEA